MGHRADCKPLFVENHISLPLARIDFGDAVHNENDIQQLLYEHSSLIPFDDIEPAFNASIAIARELPTDAGPIDLLFLNNDGYITIVETKLWRNPQSRREVVSQLIDYAAALSKMTFEQLVNAIRRTKGNSAFQWSNQFKEGFDATRFHDGVCRNLRKGRFLLIAVGDGIQEGVESMSEFLNSQPHLGFTLALVELAMFRLPKSDAFVVFPRIVSRTREVVRTIIEINGEGRMEVSTPEPSATRSSGRYSISEEKYFEELAKCDKSLVESVKQAIEDMQSRNVEVTWTARGPSFRYWPEGSTRGFSLAFFNSSGQCGVRWLPGEFERMKIDPAAAWNYVNAVKSLFSDAIWQTDRAQLVAKDGSPLPLRPLLKQRTAWLLEIEKVTAALDKAFDEN